MSDYPVQGKLRFRPDHFERDLQFVKERVGEVSNPRIVGFPGFDFMKFWWVDFAATSTQWAALEPELAARNVFATMYESPALASDENAGDRPHVTHKSPYRWVPYTGIALCLVALALAVVLRDLAPVLCGLSVVGAAGALVSGALVAVMEY